MSDWRDLPRCDGCDNPTPGSQLTSAGHEGRSGYLTIWLCPTCYERWVESGSDDLPAFLRALDRGRLGTL